jgi:carboxyl-terminal processing protease
MSKSAKILLVVIASVLLLSLSFTAGCVINLASATPTASPNMALINQAWGILTQKYVVPSKVDPTVLNQGAISGMVQSINDPYSYYLSPTDYKLTQGNFQSSFGGIGASISLSKDKQPIIVDTMDNSPALKAGLQSEDVILAVNDKSTEGLTVEQVVALVRGPIGTSVKLTILRGAQTTPLEIQIVRAEINPTTVKYRMQGDVAYIQISNFYERTNDELQVALQNLDLKNSRGVIIDLRNNLGGYVNIVVEIASHFVKEGTIIIQQDNQGNRTPVGTKPNGVFTDLPVVVLVNKYSASGSEVLSGALQDYKRATIAGVQTFGKGSYDTFYQLQDGSAIYLTIGRWLTPLGREIEGKGITPDQILTETGDAAVQWAVTYLDKAK